MRRRLDYLFAKGPVLVVLAALATGGCATLPKSGPLGRTIVNDAANGHFSLVEVDSQHAVPTAPEPALFSPLPTQGGLEVNAIAPGDMLTVLLYEVGVRIFAANSAPASDTAFDPAAKAQQFGPMEVTDEGTIRLPYVGIIKVAGRKPAQVERDIEARMAGRSEHSQVVVRQDAAIGSAVIVGGEVSNPGRFRLSAAHEKLLDIITLAGGYRGTGMSDLEVYVYRRGIVSEAPLEGLNHSNGGGIEMQPGDRVEVLRRPRSYSVVGTSNRINRFDLPTRQVSLMEALALAGGPNDNLSDPAALFLFRYVKAADGKEVPTVYHLNMMKPASYFLAQKFILENKDVIYVAGARANQPTKLLQTIGQVFTPFLLIRGAIK